MVKHATHLLQRASPVAQKLHKSARRPTRLAQQHQKSPFPVNLARSPGLRSRLHSTNTSRFLSERAELSTILEEPEEDEAEPAPHRYAGTREAYKHLEPWPQHGSAQAGSSKRHEVEHDADMLGWDDESTLVAMLQENTSEQDEEERLIALIESLKEPMAAQGATLKEYLKNALLPAYSSIKAAHDVLDEKVDLAFGAGLLTFDEICKKVERIALRDEDELKTTHAGSQRKVTRILEDLEQAYARRKDLWTALEEDLDRCDALLMFVEAARATAALEGLPLDVEQTIVLLEKKAKALDKDSSASANQKMLRGLLEKL
ncbi:hypothetical protein BD311DRAFT_707386 [Dichomitus squalens]|uniref:Uncharacterized protein n=1 Tax=Dichomitus squalens TaxID=114155 RepID=A0A4Q9N8V5_9APHY|nr:hypothetical protein BD311DRAFT_707386 [Dichomitus squalens]